MTDGQGAVAQLLEASLDPRQNKQGSFVLLERMKANDRTLFLTRVFSRACSPSRRSKTRLFFTAPPDYGLDILPIQYPPR